MAEEKIIMYDSDEAAKYVTGISGWVNSEGRFWGKDEHMARWSGCTHTKCQCGKVIPIRSYTICDTCRHKKAVENYNKLPFKEWDRQEPICTWDGDRYFFNEEDLIDFMEDNQMTNIDLLLCEENHWYSVNEDYWDDIMPEGCEGELPKKLQEALDNLNKIAKELPPCSYSPAKIRTSYKLNEEQELEVSDTTQAE